MSDQQDETPERHIEIPVVPKWRDHFAAPVIWPGRPQLAAEEQQSAEEPAAPAGEPEAAWHLAREPGQASDEERDEQARRLAAGMRPIASDAGQLVVRALSLGSVGLDRLARRIEERSRRASGQDPPPRT
jgi:hypothetical protein